MHIRNGTSMQIAVIYVVIIGEGWWGRGWEGRRWEGRGWEGMGWDGRGMGGATGHERREI